MLKLKFVYKVLPVLVHYVSDESKSPKMAGVCFGPYIRIKEGYEHDIGLLQHELEHTKQMYRSLGLNFLLYRFKKFRYKYELQAYIVQLSYEQEDNLNLASWTFAGFMANNYSLNVDQYPTQQALLKGLK